MATFTTHLSQALTGEFPDLACQVVAMNDRGRHYEYPGQVCFQIAEADLAGYQRAADFLNVNAVDVLSVQHEYGIYGGKAGAHVLSLLRDLRMPIVTTLHTILREPNADQHGVMKELIGLSTRLVVMSAHGAEIMKEVYRVPEEKIDLIPHGIPDIPFSAQDKDRLGVDGKTVILTFGLLAPDKGIEYVIDAMPSVLAMHPDTVYIILGATHPHVRERQGETYRLMLQERAQKLGVAGNIIFHNRFVSQEELNEFLAAADIYITPYLAVEQITSGTLAYAVGCGKAVISTPYLYAKELLADGRGMLVPSKDSESIARALHGLLGDEEARLSMRLRTAAYGRNMLWPAVARSYRESFEKARQAHVSELRTRFHAKTLAERSIELPEPNLDHLLLMTDQTGILQHGRHTVPRYEDGYCVDDNARALLLMTLLEEEGEVDSRVVLTLASRYLAFLNYAFNPGRGRFRNFMSYSRLWTEEHGSEDSHGRALWALGTTIGRSSDHGRQMLCRELFEAAVPAMEELTSPRAWAYGILGMNEYLRVFPVDSHVKAALRNLADRLMDLYDRSAEADWPWFEDRLTYCNARLPQAALAAGGRLEKEAMTLVGLRTLEWLAEVQTSAEGYFAPVGCKGFYRRGYPKAAFDQQPVEAAGMTSACLSAYHTTGSKAWMQRAQWALNWFLGGNQIRTPLYDAKTGGCRDGLQADRPNENQGAEATLSFLSALLELRIANRIANSSIRTPLEVAG